MFASIILNPLTWLHLLLVPLQIFGVSATRHVAASAISAPFPRDAPVAEANVCGNPAAPPAHYQHIIWILEENKSLSQVIGTKSAPFISSLAKQCAYSTNFVDNEPRSSFGRGYHSVGHYIADLSGSNCLVGNARSGSGCLTDRTANIPAHPLASVSLMEQITTAGLTWRSYQESAPHNCTLKNYAAYAPRHDGTLYFSRIRRACTQFDQPIPALSSKSAGAFMTAIKTNSLPSFTYVTPNLRDDMHSGSVAHGDACLRAYLEPIIRSSSYQSGNTAVFIIWDEANRLGQPLPNLVLASGAHAGPVGTAMSGFSVLGATESMLGLPKLGCATGTPPGNIGSCYAGASTDLRTALHI